MAKNIEKPYARTAGMEWLIENQAKVQYNHVYDEKEGITIWEMYDRKTGKLIAKNKTLNGLLEACAKKAKKG